MPSSSCSLSRQIWVTGITYLDQFGQVLLYTRTDFMPKEVAKLRPKIDKFFFITIQIEASNSVKSDKIGLSTCHLLLTLIISEFWISVVRFKTSYIPEGILATLLLFVLKCVSGLISVISLAKKLFSV